MPHPQSYFRDRITASTTQAQTKTIQEELLSHDLSLPIRRTCIPGRVHTVGLTLAIPASAPPIASCAALSSQQPLGDDSVRVHRLASCSFTESRLHTLPIQSHSSLISVDDGQRGNINTGACALYDDDSRSAASSEHELVVNSSPLSYLYECQRTSFFVDTLVASFHSSPSPTGPGTLSLE